MELTQEIVRELLDYNPDTGVLTWKFRSEKWFATTGAFKSWNTRFAGVKAGSVSTRISNNKWSLIHIFDKTYRPERIIHLWLHGVWPNRIDHTDGNGLNNCKTNLRNGTHAESCRNRTLSKSNNTGVSGVRNRNGRYSSQITINSKQIWLGSFKNLEDAITARKEAEIKYNFHPNHGRASNV